MNALRLTPTHPLTTPDLEKCLHTIKQIIQLTQCARREGLLSLESILSDLKHPFLLRKGIGLVVDGNDRALIEAILSRYILAGQYNGFDLVNRQIIMQGVLLIQNGEHPRTIQECLIAFLGEDYYDTATQQLND